MRCTARWLSSVDIIDIAMVPMMNRSIVTAVGMAEVHSATIGAYALLSLAEHSTGKSTTTGLFPP